MKKRFAIFMIGFLLVAANVFAGDGDVIVNGNLGVGTTSPGSKLDVYGSGDNIMSATDTSTSNKHATIIGHNGTRGIIRTTFWGTPGGFTPLTLQTSNVDRIYISTDGNVGVGTTTPGAKLEVAGNIKFQSAAMSSPEDILLKSLAADYAAGLGGPPVYHYWNDGAGQSCATKCSNMGHTCVRAYAVHPGYVSAPGCSYDGTAGLACLCSP